ncbi:MAG: hypothetical protein LBD41_03180 [Clostridiales Family XIII bacterium]|jgi:uncharacterized coiled-coil protein SlyX|nr:hypothetical protein [Clostridiales Family XIII bacterium]
MTDPEKTIAELKAQIAELQKATRKTRGPQKVKLMTPSRRAEKDFEEAEKIQKQLARLLQNPLNDLTPSQVVDAYSGGLADLPPLSA